MKIRYILSALVLVLFVVSASFGAVTHKYLMKGSVLEATDGTVYLCVGTSDGAKAGQELTVVRFTKTGTNPKGGPMFKKEEVGKVKIEEIVDEHMANAKIISGEAKVNDIVELHK